MSVAASLLVVTLCAPADLVADLYAHRLMFDGEGRPVVPVGLMQGAGRLVVESDGGLVVTLSQGGGREERVEVAPRTPITLERVGGAAGQVEELWVIETLEREDRLRRREVAERWRAQGVPVEVVSLGPERTQTLVGGRRAPALATA